MLCSRGTKFELWDIGNAHVQCTHVYVKNHLYHAAVLQQHSNIKGETKFKICRARFSSLAWALRIQHQYPRIPKYKSLKCKMWCKTWEGSGSTIPRMITRTLAFIFAHTGTFKMQLDCLSTHSGDSHISAHNKNLNLTKHVLYKTLRTNILKRNTTDSRLFCFFRS